MTSHSGPPCNLPAPPLLGHAQDFEAIPQDFDLPTLGPVLRAMRQDVQHGRGFALLRGLPVDRWTRVQVRHKQHAHGRTCLGARTSGIVQGSELAHTGTGILRSRVARYRWLVATV